MRLNTSFKKRAEAIAVDWRYRLRLRVHDELPAERLIAEFQGEAVTPDHVPGANTEITARLLDVDDWSAAIIRRSPLLIVYHPAHSYARRQANLMHEMAHILLDHPMVGFDPTTGLPVRDPECEEEATYLGSCLQIPRLGLKWAVHQGWGIKSIAQHFGASEDLVRFRGNMTGIQILST